MSIGRVFSVAEPTAVAEGAGLLAAFGTSVVIIYCCMFLVGLLLLNLQPSKKVAIEKTGTE